MRQKAFVTLIGGADSANNSIFRQKKSSPTVKQVREIGDSCQILETGTGISKTLSNKKRRWQVLPTTARLPFYSALSFFLLPM